MLNKFEFMNLDIHLKRSALDFVKKRLIIDTNKFSYGREIIRVEEISEVRYGIVQLYINGIKANRIYEIAINSISNKKIKVSFQSIQLFFTNQKLNILYEKIIGSLWENVTKKLVQEAIDKLEKGKPFIMKKIEVHPKGVYLNTRRWYGKKEKYFVEWKDLRKYSEEGEFYVYSIENSRAKVTLKYNRDWNTPVLDSLLDYLWKDGNAYLLSDKF